jgi:hypothetical protein
MAFHKSKKTNPLAIIGAEKSLLNRHYKFINFKIKNGVLYCYGSFQPTTESDTYSYRIKYKPFSSPVTTVTSHDIKYNDDIHMFPDNNSLCLYHKSDMVWDSTIHHLYDTIVPWTHEWFVFYELYKLCGKWLHPEVKHNSRKKKKD